MWRSVGSIGANPQDQPNSPRQQNPYESFAQLSRLKNNVSQLSSQHPQHFMSEYFSKKRGTQAQVHSHHALPLNTNVSTPLHLRSKNLQKRNKIQTASIEEALPPPKIDLRENALRLSRQVQSIREEYNYMSDSVRSQLEQINRGLTEFRKDMGQRILRLQQNEGQRQQMTRNRVEVVGRMSRQSALWREKMEEIDKRKEALRSSLTTSPPQG